MRPRRSALEIAEGAQCSPAKDNLLKLFSSRLWQPLSPSKNKLMALLNSGNLFKSNDDKSLATAAESPASPQKATKAVKRKPAPKKNKGKGKISDIEDGNVESSKPKVPRKAKSTKADIERDNIVARPSSEKNSL